VRFIKRINGSEPMFRPIRHAGVVSTRAGKPAEGDHQVFGGHGLGPRAVWLALIESIAKAGPEADGQCGPRATPADHQFAAVACRPGTAKLAGIPGQRTRARHIESKYTGVRTSRSPPAAP